MLMYTQWEWRKVHNEELNDLHCSPNIARVIKWSRMRWVAACSTMGEERGVYRVLVGKHEGERPLGRPRHRWEDRLDLQKVECGGMGRIELIQDRDGCRALVNALMNLLFPWNAGSFLTGWKPISLSRKTLLRGVSRYTRSHIKLTTLTFTGRDLSGSPRSRQIYVFITI